MRRGWVMHGSLFAVAAVSVFSLQMVFAPRYLQQRADYQKQVVHQSIQGAAQSWNALRFTSGPDGALGEVVLRKLNWFSLPLDDIQRSALTKRIVEVFQFLSKPRFESYYALKTGRLANRLSLTRQASDLLETSTNSTKGIDSAEAKELIRQLWLRVASPTSMDGPSCIESISLERIRAATRSTNSHNAVPRGPTFNGLTTIEEALEPGFCYGAQAVPVSADTAQGRFFHLSFIAHSNASTNAGPVYLSLYWSEADRQWALSRLFTDRLLRMRLLF